MAEIGAFLEKGKRKIHTSFTTTKHLAFMWDARLLFSFSREGRVSKQSPV